jgi:hypothetical protein
MSTPITWGHPPDEKQEAMIEAAAEHWRKVSYEAPIQALTRIEEAAKQLVALTGTLNGLYFAIITFSDLREQVTNWLIIPFLLPVALWLASLFCATRVFVPQVRFGADIDDFSIHTWQRIRDTYSDTVAHKLVWLHLSHWFLISSFVVVLLLLILQAFLPAALPSGPTQIIILTPTPIP